MRTLALLLAVSAAAFAQCTVDGTVVNSVSGAPIERAHVSIIAGGDTFLTDSDSLGQWNVTHIPCDSVTVLINRPGFLRTQQSIAKPAHDIRLKLAPQAVLTGRVLDEQGEPLLGAQVSLMTSRVINGVRGVQASTSEVTNDLGEYRFSGLTAGKYILCANSGGGPIVTGSRPYGDKCYPGSMPMDVTAGFESRIDFTLLPLTTVRVSGQISGQSGSQRTTVVLVPRTQIARMSMGLSAPVRPDGRFTIRNVPPSSYMALVTSDNRQTAIPVEIGSNDVESLQLHIEPGATVTGTVKPAFKGVGIQLQRDFAADGVAFSQPAEWNSSGTVFTLSNIPSGNYRVQLTGPNAPFYVRSVTLENRDISNSTFMVAPGMGMIEVLLADDGGAVEGDVSEGPGWVLAQKDGVSSRNIRTDTSGHFKIENLPPGDYKVYAWDDNTNVEYGNPDWMRQNSKGVAVSVAPGQTVQVKVTRETAPAN